MSKTIFTRIKNKADLLSNWQSSNTILLDGEIAIVRVPTGETYTNPVTGVNEPVVELLMKVGDGAHKFNEVDSEGNPYLPWLSAKASDVYNWAKQEDLTGAPVKVLEGDNETTVYLGAYLTSLTSLVSANAADIEANESAITNLQDVQQDGTGNVVTAVSLGTDKKIHVTKGKINTGDINNIETYVDNRVVNNFGGNVNNYIQNAFNTYIENAEIDVDKVIVTPEASGKEAETLNDRLGTIDADIENLKVTVIGGMHFVGTTTTKLEDGASTAPVINSKTYQPKNGDIVLYKTSDTVADQEKEFIWVQPEGATSGKWEELGDLSRVAALESWVDGVGGKVEAASGKIITKVELSADGKLSGVGPGTLDAEDITYDINSTVDAALDTHAAKLDGISSTVVDYVAGEINKLDSTTSGSGNIVTSVTQTDGKVTVTKANLADIYPIPEVPTATKDVLGKVKLSDAVNVSTYSDGIAATPNAVYAAYQYAATADSHATDAQTRVGNIEAGYVKASADNKLVYSAGDTVEEIIFDCGGAEDL